MYKAAIYLLAILSLNSYANIQQLDTSFGSKGITTVISPYGRTVVTDLVEIENGKFLVVGHFDNVWLNKKGNGYLVGRINNNGTVDISFANSGFLELSQFIEPIDGGLPFRAKYVFTSQDGGFFIVGIHNIYTNDGFKNSIRISKHSDNGQLIDNYGKNGISEVNLLDSASNFYDFKAFIDSNENITITGLTTENKRSRYLISRTNYNGRTDTDFGTDGLIEVDIDTHYTKTNGNKVPMRLGNLHIASNDSKIITVSSVYGESSDFEDGDHTKLLLHVFNGNGQLQSKSFIEDKDLSSNYIIKLNVNDEVSLASAFQIEHGKNKIGILKFDLLGKPINSFGDFGLATFDVKTPVDRFPFYSLHDLIVKKDNSYLIIGSKFSNDDLFALNIDVNGYLSNPSVDINTGKLNLSGFVSANELSNGDILINAINANLSSSHLIKLNSNLKMSNSFLSEGRTFAVHFNAIREIEGMHDGSMLIGGYGSTSNDPFINKNIALISKLTPEGEIDLSFGSQGYAEVAYGDGVSSYSLTIFDIEVYTDNHIIAAGVLHPDDYDPSSINLFVTKLASNGSLDTSFADSGFFIFDPKMIENEYYNTAFANDVEIMNDNSIIISGYISGSTKVRGFFSKLTPNGELDKSFGENGFLIYELEDKNNYFFDIVKSGDDSFIAAGVIDNQDGKKALAVKINNSGSVDKSFGVKGASILGTEGASNAAFSITSNSKGKYYLAGYSQKISADNHLIQEASVVSILENGHLDTSFGTEGKVNIGWGSVEFNRLNSAKGIEIDPLGNLIVTGYADLEEHSNKSNIGLAMLTASGALLPTFGNAGIANLNFGNSTAWKVKPTSDDSFVFAGKGYGIGLVTKIVGYKANTDSTDNTDSSDTSVSSKDSSSGGSFDRILLLFMLLIMLLRRNNYVRNKWSQSKLN